MGGFKVSKSMLQFTSSWIYVVMHRMFFTMSFTLPWQIFRIGHLAKKCTFIITSGNQRTIGPVSLTWVLSHRLLGRRRLKILNLSDLDQGQWITLTFHIPKASCTNLVDCSFQLWCHRLKYFLKNPLFNFFSIQKHRGANLTVSFNRSRLIQGHHLNKLGSTRAPDAAHQVSRLSAFWFQRRRFLRGFIMYGHGGHIGHVT